MAQKAKRMRKLIEYVVLVALSPFTTTWTVAAEKPADLRASESDPQQLAKTLSGLDVWILPQPKFAKATDGTFDLAACQGVQLAGKVREIEGLAKDFLGLLKERSGVELTTIARPKADRVITLGLLSGGTPPPQTAGIAASELKGLKLHGYVLHIDSEGVSAVAADPEGLRYAMQTIAQIATDRTTLPGVHIRDWPSLEYRGVQYDVSRGQMPTIDTLKRLSRVLREAKGNVLELYIEDMFKWRSHPDIAPSEAISPEEARSLFDDANAHCGVEVQPVLQVLGHFDRIGSKPAYKRLMVPVPSGGTAGHAWTTTVDVRKPEAVALVTDLLNEICEAFPGKFVNVDLTEIADYGFVQGGTKADALPELMLDYMLKLRNVVAKHKMRLMIQQCPLDQTGHLNGIGSVLDRVPKDIAVASYYTAEFYGGWEADFPRLQKQGIDLFAMPWIDSHAHIMPFVGHAKEFSDITIGRGVQYGAKGSITADWGDDGHYHMPGMTWYPFLYHCASAWTGAKLDRDYFDQAFCRILFGTKDSRIAKAIQLAGNINGQPLKLKNAAGAVVETHYSGNDVFGRYYFEFFGNPFTDPKIVEIVAPGQKGRDVLQPADSAVSLLASARNSAVRNGDVLDELLFAAKNYQAIGRKLVARDHYLDEAIPRDQVAAELNDLATFYESLRGEFKRLWMAECKNAGSFQRYVQRYDHTISPCKTKANELLKK